MASIVSDKDYCLFYRFWAFEYGKRNKEFQEAIARVYTTSDYEEKKRCKLKLSSWGFVGWIEYYCTNYTKHIDLIKLIEPKHEITYPDNHLFINDDITITSYNGTENKHKFQSGLTARPGQAIAKIDFSVSLDELTQSIKDIYKDYHNSKCLTEQSGMNILPSGDLYAKERMRISSNSDISFEIDYAPRAVGLWIWDYVESKWGTHPPAKQTGFLSEAVDALKSLSPAFKSRYGASAHQTFSKLYKRTSSCVQSVKVLTLK